MSETPSGYCPDFKVQWTPKLLKRHRTEQLLYRSGRRQRRPLYGTSGFYRFEAPSDALVQADRLTLFNFLDARRGAYQSFYFFRPDPASFSLLNCGSVSAATSVIVPIKGTWFQGQTPVAANYDAVTVGGVTPTALVVTPNIGSGGEDRLSWTGVMTGTVLVTGRNMRLRIVSIYDGDDIIQEFLQDAADVRAIFQMVIQEVA